MIGMIADCGHGKGRREREERRKERADGMALGVEDEEKNET